MSLKKAQAILADCQNSCCPPPSHGRPHCCVQVCEVQTRCLSNTRVILANSPSSTEMQHGEPREWGVNSGSSPGGHLHRCGAAPFPGQAGAPPTQHPQAPLPWALPGSLSCPGAAWGEPEHSPFWRGNPPSALQLLPPSWPRNRAELPPGIARALAACPSAQDLFEKAHFSLLPSSSVTHSPSPGFFPPSLPTCETLNSELALMYYLPSGK